MPQDRLRKFTEENLELAKNLKKEIDRVNQMSRSSGKPSTTKSRRGAGSARPSEERSTPLQVAGKKRVRDADTERVSLFPAPSHFDKGGIFLPPDLIRFLLAAPDIYVIKSMS